MAELKRAEDGSVWTLVTNTERPSIPLETSIEPVGTTKAIYRVPVDIWFCIFYMGTHLDGEDGGNFPVVVSHVCRFWREVAMNSPLLWTSIRISSASIETLIGRDGPVLPRASAFTLRSMQCSLDVKLDLTKRRSTGNISDESILMYLRLLCSTAVDLLLITYDRIKSLDIVTDLKETSFWISHKIIPLGLPRLESWKICRGDPAKPVNSSLGISHHRGFHEFDASGTQGGLFGSPTDTIGARLPCLKHLQISQIVTNWSTWLIGGLTTLTINHLAQGNRPSINDLRGILAKSSHSLESLELHGSLPVRPFENPNPITLPKLRHLRLGYWTEEEALTLLPHLDMPALKSLALCDISGAIYEHHRRLRGGDYVTDINIEDFAVRGVPLNQELDSSHLLQALFTTRLSLLHQLESVELTRVQTFSFWTGPPRDWIDEAFPRHHVCIARFLLSMPALRSLTLDGPDVGFLHCFNHPFLFTVDQPALSDGVAKFVLYPGGQLSTLRIFDTEYDDLLDFFFHRAELARDPTTRRGVPVLETLEFSLDASEVEQFKSECPSADGAVNVGAFAKAMICRVYNDIPSPRIPFI